MILSEKDDVGHFSRRMRIFGQHSFQVSKGELRVSPVYLHKDERIEAMLLVNMQALLAYSLLERQACHQGPTLATRRIIARLQTLEVVETVCWDGSALLQLVPVDEEQMLLLQVLAHVVAELRVPRWSHLQLASGETRCVSVALSPHDRWSVLS